MKTQPFAAAFDIETTELHAVAGGVITCAVVQPIGGGKPVVFRLDKYGTPKSDRRLVKALIEELSKYELLIGQNSEDFDWAFIRSRAIRFGIRIPRPFPLSYDLKGAFKRSKLRTVDNGHGKPTASLDMQIDFFRLPQQKTKVGYPNERYDIVNGTPEERKRVLDLTVHHCIKDVEMTTALYYRIMREDPNPLIRRLK